MVLNNVEWLAGIMGMDSSLFDNDKCDYKGWKNKKLFEKIFLA